LTSSDAPASQSETLFVSTFPSCETLLEFWFGDLDEGYADAEHSKRWYLGGAAFDRECTERFSALAVAASKGELDSWLLDARGTLAYILVCDQLPRNIYRGTPEAFATDPLALAAARAGIEQGMDTHLGHDERSFFYMPFEHSESVLDQHTSVGLFARLLQETPAHRRDPNGKDLQYAHDHRDLILRFGRFPHRNDVLDRASTAEEVEYLKHGSRFGQ